MTSIVTSIDTLLSLKIVTHSIALIIIPSRQWILRHQTTGRSTTVTTASIMLFLGIYLYCGVLVIMQCIYEKQAENMGLDNMGMEQRLLTKAYFQRLFANSVVYTFLLWLLKFAFLGYFANLRDVLTRRARILFTASCIYTVLTFLTTLFVQLFWCYPIARNWSLDPTTQCVHFKTLTVSTVHAVLNLTTDLLILVMALIIISSLNLNRFSRFALLFITLIGSVSIIMCIIRFFEVYKAITDPRWGPLQVVRQLTFWGNIEVFFALVAFCAPAFRVLITSRKRLGSVSTDAEKRSGRSNGSWDEYHSVDIATPQLVQTKI